MGKTQLETAVANAAINYLDRLDGEIEPNNIYRLIIGSAEEALIRTILKKTGDNQSKTAAWLGLSRNTLRAKMLQYGMLAAPEPKPAPAKRRNSR